MSPSASASASVSVSATVDDREPPGVIEAVRAHPDVRDARVARLSAGDVVVSVADADADAIAGDEPTVVGIERKTPDDYVASAFGTAGSDLYDQTARLREAYDRGYVLIEGTLAATEAAAVGPDPAAVRGSVASLTARHVPVIPCSDRERLVDVAIRLGRKHAEKPGRRSLDGGAVTARREPVTKRIYGCIEGVGPATAERLHDAFPTVAALTRASTEELTAVEGVGEGRAAAIRESLHGDGGDGT